MRAPSTQEPGGDTTRCGEDGCADSPKTIEMLSNQSSNMQAPAMQKKCITIIVFQYDAIRRDCAGLRSNGSMDMVSIAIRMEPHCRSAARGLSSASRPC